MFDTDGERGALYGTALMSSPAPVAYNNASDCSNLLHVLVDSKSSDHYFDDFVIPELKVAVNTIVPRSPFFFVFVPQNPDCYTHQKKRGRICPSMEWRYLCYLQLVSKAKHPLTPMAKEEVCPRDEIADPPGMAVLPIDIYGFDEGLVSFRTLCGVQSSLVRFAPNQAIDWGPLQWQAC